MQVNKDEQTAKSKTNNSVMTRFFALALAYFFLALAVIGIFLPGLPTVPFLLLTAWFAARGSQRLHRQLYAHPILGALLNDWEQQRAISRKSKLSAVAMLMISWGIMYRQLDNVVIIAGMTCLLLVVASYLISRPEPKCQQ